MRRILIFGVFFFAFALLKAQPANNLCANATALTVDGALVCGTTNSATTQAGEHCAASGGGITPRTIWYSFVATILVWY
ncbi:MAG: hypothetical protein ACK4K0_11580 [Flavobacteriales bacterium]